MKELGMRGRRTGICPSLARWRVRIDVPRMGGKVCRLYQLGDCSLWGVRWGVLNRLRAALFIEGLIQCLDER
jgi:hypothetical protein